MGRHMVQYQRLRAGAWCFRYHVYQQIWPIPVTNFDRQLGLEFSLERSFRRVFGKDLLSEPLYGFVPTPSTPAVPYLLLNLTRVEDGLRIIMSPIYFKAEQYGGRDDWHFIDYLNGPPLSAAAGTSARFPIISPPGYFVSRNVKDGGSDWIPDPKFIGRKNRFVDGGYFDNSGAPTLLELYRELYPHREGQERTLGRQQFSIRILHVGNAPICDESASTKANQRPCRPSAIDTGSSGSSSDFLNALITVMNVRATRVDYGLNQLFNEVTRVSSEKLNPERDQAEFEFGVHPKSEEEITAIAQKQMDRIWKEEPSVHDSYSRVQMHDQGIPEPLGWLLSSRAATSLRSQIGEGANEGICAAQDPRNLCQLNEVLSLIDREAKKEEDKPFR
jgi:hypothetical protein